MFTKGGLVYISLNECLQKKLAELKGEEEYFEVIPEHSMNKEICIKKISELRAYINYIKEKLAG